MLNIKVGPLIGMNVSVEGKILEIVDIDKECTPVVKVIPGSEVYDYRIKGYRSDHIMVPWPNWIKLKDGRTRPVYELSDKGHYELDGKKIIFI